MVLPGQYLERPTLIVRTPATDQTPGLTLEGLFHRGSQAPGVVVCAPHPRMGGSMDSAVVAELAWALSRAGHASLRFNYQGVGASEGDVHALPVSTSESTPAPLTFVGAEAEDARAAVRHLTECVDHRKVAIAGYSFGAAVALQLALEHPALSHLILIAPPTALFDFGALAQISRPTLVVAGQHDTWTDKLFFSELASRNNALRWELIAHADHTFSRGLTDLGKTVTTWLDATRASH